MFKIRPSKHLKTFLLATLTSSFILLSACGGSSSGTNQTHNSVPSADPGTEDTIATDLSRNKAYTGQAQLGPLVDASVELRHIDQLDAPALYVTRTLNSNDLETAGLFTLPEESIEDPALYLLSVSGGNDIDANDDGVIDESPTANAGTVHTILTGAQIKQGNFGVNILTEVAYQNSRYLLSTQIPQEDLQENLDAIAKHLLQQDITNDKAIAANDLLAWQPTLHQSALTRDYANYQSLISDIHAGKDILYNALPFISFEIAHVDWHSPQDVVLKGDYALLAHAQDGLGIIDISNPKQPIILTNTPQLHRDGQAIAVQNNNAYIAVGVDFNDTPGLAVWDVTDPSQANLDHFIDAPYKEQYRRNCITVIEGNSPVRRCELFMLAATQVALSDQYAYVLYHARDLFEEEEVALEEQDSLIPEEGLQVIDIQTNQQVDFVPLTDGGEIALTADGQTLYLLEDHEIIRYNTHKDSGGNLEIAENTNRFADQFAIQGGTLFSYSLEGNLEAYSLPLSAESAPLSSLPISEDRATTLEVAEETAYIGFTGTVKIVDVGDLSNPVYKASASPRGPGVLGTAAAGNYLYVANHNDGLVISDLQAVHADDNYIEKFPAVISNIPARSSSLASDGHYLYASNGALSTYEMTSEGVLNTLSTLPFEDAGAMQVINQQLITASDNQHISTFSLATPSEPTLEGFTKDVEASPLPVYSKGLVITDHYAYLSTTGYGVGDIAVHVYDLSGDGDNARINSITPAESETWLTCAVRHGDYLYSIGYRRLEIFDIHSNPASPTHEATLDFPVCEEMIIDGTTAYVAAGGSGVFIYDVSDPLAPTELSQFDTTGVAGGLYLEGSHLYIGSYNSVSVADISNPLTPRLIAAAKTPGEPSKLLVSDEHVYVIDGSNGITVLPTLKNKSTESP